MNNPKLWSKNFINISLSSFFLFTTFYTLLVTLPIYSLRSFHSKPYQAGLLVTVFILAAIVIRPLAGRWIELFGKKTVLIIALLLFIVSTSSYFIPDSLAGLLVLRFIHGLGFGMATTVAGTIVADIIPETRRGEGMGYYTMAMNLAMVVGPFIGLTSLEKWGIQSTFIISIVFAALAMTAGFFVRLEEETVKNKEQKGAFIFSFQRLYEPSALKISLVGAFFALIYSAILSFVSVYAKEKGLADVSSYFFVVYAVVLLVSRPFTGKWFDRFGANVIIYPAIVSFALGMFLLSTLSSPLGFLFSAGLIGLGWGTLFPMFQTIAIQLAPPAKRGLATATFLSIFDLGIGAGSAVVGWIGAKLGFGTFYLLSSFLVLAGIFLYYSLHGKTTGKVQTPLKHTA